MSFRRNNFGASCMINMCLFLLRRHNKLDTLVICGDPGGRGATIKELSPNKCRDRPMSANGEQLR